MAAILNRVALLWLLLAGVTIACGVAAAAMMMSPPKDLDLSLRQSSAGGAYKIVLEPGTDPVPLRQIHSWTISVTTPAGVPVDGAVIAVDGGMPQHGHGLPTKPQVTKELGHGRYLLEGVKFNMSGWWKLSVRVNGTKGTDEATFNLVL
ncbi:FixH family protein [Mesorhizobium sp. KR1-2]|uniref:FixH family protein n=1 Tax=Mesorhizobium sp. KR1-2 TaxID=3156609 RepID=UPI0032B3C901